MLVILLDDMVVIVWMTWRHDSDILGDIVDFR